MRAFNRYEYVTEVLIEYESETFKGIIKNISQGGVFININKSFPIGTTIALKFNLPKIKDQIVTQAQLRWIQKDENNQLIGIGVQFLRLKPIEVWAINQLSHPVKD